MVVYGKYKSKYVLAKTAERTDYDGPVYKVPARPGVKVKIYNPNMRTSLQETEVINAVNGTGAIQGVLSPIEVVYSGGRFIGYAFQEEETAPEPGFSPPPPVGPVRTPVVGIPLLAAGGIALLLSVLVVLVIFPKFEPEMPEMAAVLCFRGFTPVLIGWGVMLYLLFTNRAEGAVGAAMGIVGFVLAAVVTVAGLWLIVIVITGAFNLVMQLLPMVITALILIAVLKYLLGNILR